MGPASHCSKLHERLYRVPDLSPTGLSLDSLIETPDNADST